MNLKVTGRLAAALAVGALFLGACNSGTAATPATSAAASAPAASSGGGAGSASGAQIGVAFPNSDTFLSRVQDGMKAKASELGVNVTITDAKDDTAAQLSQVENFVSQKVAAIIVVPVDTSAAQPMADAAKAANIPIVFVNRNPSIAGVPYVGSDSLYAGTVEMTELAKLAGGKGDVVILEGQVTNEAAVQRTQGCNDVVAKNPGMKVAATQAGDWDRAKGQSIAENWIQSGTLKEGMVVCANNDEMALGAINALKAANLLDKVFVGGVDATSEALAAMQAGDLEVTVFQDAKGQGNGGVQAAVDVINGKTVPDFVDIPYQLVTPANINDFLNKN
ncbi:MAG: sugar ABC transporter substrate-binding protein [Chloroflexota bacterium]